MPTLAKDRAMPAHAPDTDRILIPRHANRRPLITGMEGKSPLAKAAVRRMVPPISPRADHSDPQPL